MPQDKLPNQPITPSSQENNEDTLEQRAKKTLDLAISRLNDPNNLKDDGE